MSEKRAAEQKAAARRSRIREPRAEVDGRGAGGALCVCFSAWHSSVWSSSRPLQGSQVFSPGAANSLWWCSYMSNYALEPACLYLSLAPKQPRICESNNGQIPTNSPNHSESEQLHNSRLYRRRSFPYFESWKSSSRPGRAAGAWIHSCGNISARTCAPTCSSECLEAILRGGGAIMTANKNQQQTNNHCSAPHLAAPHPAIKAVSLRH